MGKRADARPEISGKLLSMVKEAQATVGKAAKHVEVAPTRPQASPARVRASRLEPAAEDRPGPAPREASPAPMPHVGAESTTPAPMSIQSTPVKSPDVKRLRSECSESSGASLPSLPSFSSNSGGGVVHGLDSQTTLDMAEYFSQLRLSGPTLCRVRHVASKLCLIGTSKDPRISEVWQRTPCDTFP